MKKKVGGSTGKTVRRVLTALGFFILMGFSSIFAGEVTFFGPKKYTRNKGKPVTIEENFTIPLNYASHGFTMTITSALDL